MWDLLKMDAMLRLSIYAIVELKFLRLFSVVGLKLVGIGKHGNFHKHVLCYVCIVLAVFLLFAYETEEVILFIVILIICFPFSNSWTKEENTKSTKVVTVSWIIIGIWHFLLIQEESRVQYLPYLDFCVIVENRVGAVGIK